MKKIIAVLVVAGLILGGRFYWNKKRTPEPEETAKPETVQVEKGSVTRKVATTGRVVANLEVEIKCKAGGEVITLPFDISDPVKKGELLVELDPEDEERRVKQAEISLSASEAKYSQAKQSLLVARKKLELAKRRAGEALTTAEADLREALARQSQVVEKRSLELERQRAAAVLTSAEAYALDARTKADRLKRLLSGDLVSQEEYETAETTAVRAESDLELARIKLEELKNEESKLEEEYEIAETSVVKAKSELALSKLRLEELKIDEQALTIKKEDVKLSGTAVELNRIDLTAARRRLKDTRVTAPMAGVISSRNVQIGQIISSAISNVGGGTTVLTLSDLSRIFVLASVDESDISKVSVGQPVIITTDAYPGKEFQGEVVRIATRGEVNANVVTFEVKIIVLGDELSLLKPEMTTNVEIVSVRKDDVLLAPVEAVKAQGGQGGVRILREDGTTKVIIVKVGISDGVNREIISGLNEGDKLVVLKGEASSRWRNPNKESMGKTGARRIMRAVH